MFKVGNKPMKLLLLNIHLERNHNRLKRLVELDGRPGINLKCIFLIKMCLCLVLMSVMLNAFAKCM